MTSSAHAARPLARQHRPHRPHLRRRDRGRRGRGEASRGGRRRQRDDVASRSGVARARRVATIEPSGTTGYGDSGTYSRFFLIPKAARSDREPVLGGLPRRRKIDRSGEVEASARSDPSEACGDDVSTTPRPRANVHPTVKPTDLMRHLVRLVTPTGGTVLDPFLGSGTTAIAAEMEGFAWIGIEREAEYVAIAEARLNGTQRGLAL